MDTVKRNASYLEGLLQKTADRKVCMALKQGKVPESSSGPDAASRSGISNEFVDNAEVEEVIVDSYNNILIYIFNG